MKNKLKLLSVITLGTLLALGWDFHPKTSATVPGMNTLVSTNQSGSAGNLDSFRPRISGNGNFVVFESSATDLVNSDYNNRGDVFVRNLDTGSTARVDVSTAGTQASDGANVGVISYTGRYVLFRSTSTNLIDGATTPNSYYQLYLRDTVTNTTTLLSKNATGDPANGHIMPDGVSSDGQFILFETNATNLGPTVTNASTSNLYMLDRSAGTFTILNKTSSGVMISNSIDPKASMNCDGSLVVFENNGLTTPSSSHRDIYLLDLRSGSKLTDITRTANGGAFMPAISCNGDYIGFTSYADNLDTSDTDHSQNYYHGFVYDRVNGSFYLADKSSSGITNNSGVYTPYGGGDKSSVSISNDGIVTFVTASTNLVNTTTSGNNVYIRNIKTGVTELLSASSAGAPANNAYLPTISADGAITGYVSTSTILTANDTNTRPDIFVSSTGY